MYDIGSSDGSGKVVSIASLRNSMDDTIIMFTSFVSYADELLSVALLDDEVYIISSINKALRELGVSWGEFNFTEYGAICSVYEGEELLSLLG